MDNITQSIRDSIAREIFIGLTAELSMTQDDEAQNQRTIQVPPPEAIAEISFAFADIFVAYQKSLHERELQA